MSTAKRTLVVGTGSIGLRHLRNLKARLPEHELLCMPASGRGVVAAEVGADRVVADIADALSGGLFLAIVASPAPLHLTHTVALVRAGVPVLVEKPLSHSLAEARVHETLLAGSAKRIQVAYNLRYLRSAAVMKQLIDASIVGRVHHVLADVGQYLPSWRPGTDYRRNVSARKELGGGVLRELSHEFDYLRWLFGDFDQVFASVRRSGALDIDVEDGIDALFTRDSSTMTVHMDFLQQAVSRQCKVIGETGTLIWDVARNTVTRLDGGGVPPQVLFDGQADDRNAMYTAQLDDFIGVAEGRRTPEVTVVDALKTLEWIDAIERSAQTNCPVPLNRHPTPMP